MPLAWVAIVFGGILLVAGAKNSSLLGTALGKPDKLPGGSPSDTPGVADPSFSDPGGVPAGSLPNLGDLLASPGGTTTIDGHPVANWIVPSIKYARAHGWGGQVTSGYRSKAQQVQACTHVCGNPGGCPGRCAPPGQSNHQGTILPKGAIDVTDPAGFEQALKGFIGVRPRRGPIIATDPVHFSFTGN